MNRPLATPLLMELPLNPQVSDDGPVIVPPMLYLPVVEHVEKGPVAVVKQLVDGRRALLAYTALDRLAQRCGPQQPWVLLSTTELDEVMKQQPFDVVGFDLKIPDHQLKDGHLA